MSDDKSLIQKFLNKNLPIKQEKKTKLLIEQAVPPRPKASLWGQTLDTRRAEEYQKTVRAVEGVVRAYADLEIAVADLDNVDIRIENNKQGFLADLEESKQRLEDLQNNGELRENQRQAEVLEAKLRQIKAKAEIIEYEAKQAEAKAKIAESEAKIKQITNPPPTEKPKTRAEKLNEFETQGRKIREVIGKNLNKALAEIDEEAKQLSLTSEEIEAKKDIELARWAKIEMEELDKLERRLK